MSSSKSKRIKKQKLLFILLPSEAHRGEVGVFAAQDISEGAHLPFFAKNDYRLWSHIEVDQMRMAEHFALLCVKDEDGYHGPKSFLHTKSKGWYLRGSDNPNAMLIELDENDEYDYQFFADRPIKAGEEITIDLRTLGDIRYK